MFKNRKLPNKSVNQLKEYKLIGEFSADFHPSHHKMIKIPQYYQENTQFRLDKAVVDHQFIRPTSIEEDFFFKDFAKDSKSKRQSAKHNSSNHHYSPPISSFDLSTFAKDLHDHRYTTLMQQNTITEDNHIPLSPIPSFSSSDNNDGSNKIAVEDDINDFVRPPPLLRIKRSVSTACHNRPSVHFQEPPKATRKSLSMNDMIAEEKKKKKKSFFGGFRSSTKAPDQHGMSRAAMAVIQHNVDQFIQPPTTNKRDTKISSFLSRASSTARKRNTKIVNMQRSLPKRDEIVRKTIIYVQPDSLHQLLKHGGNGVCIPPQQPKYTSDQESLSSDESYMEGVELREMKDGTVTWGVVKKQGNRKSFYARYDDHQFEFVEEEEEAPPIPKRSPHRDDIYYSKDLTLPRLVKLMNDQYPTMSVDDQLDEMIQIIKSQQ